MEHGVSESEGAERREEDRQLKFHLMEHSHAFLVSSAKRFAPSSFSTAAAGPTMQEGSGHESSYVRTALSMLLLLLLRSAPIARTLCVVRRCWRQRVRRGESATPLRFFPLLFPAAAHPAESISSTACCAASSAAATAAYAAAHVAAAAALAFATSSTIGEAGASAASMRAL
jgi:hypothetical protein